MTGTEGHFSLKKIGDLTPTGTTASSSTQTVSFDHLIPNELYNFYAMKDKEAENGFSASNLLYIAQASVDGAGKLSVSYIPKESVADADVFVVGAEQNDISIASVSLPDMEYTGTMQYAELVVTYGGKTLSEFEDYELSGDYSAQDVGTYTLTIYGIGEYKGAITALYKLKEEESKKVQKIALSVANTSLTAGKTLQLKAQVSPASAENQTLKWISDNKSVATVDQNGVVTAVGEGKATIKVSSTDGSNISASCVISVTKQSGGGGSTTPTNPTGPTGPTTPTGSIGPATPTAPATPTNPTEPGGSGLETSL